MDDRYEWDPKKEAANRRKRGGVSFEEGKTVFDDPLRTERIEDQSSSKEQRWFVFGQSAQGKLLRVVYCERGEKIRLISVRKAAPRERQAYEESQ